MCTPRQGVLNVCQAIDSSDTQLKLMLHPMIRNERGKTSWLITAPTSYVKLKKR